MNGLAVSVLARKIINWRMDIAFVRPSRRYVVRVATGTSGDQLLPTF